MHTKTVGINPAIASDHAIPWVSIQCERNITHGRGYWKINNSLLNEDDYKIAIRDIIAKVNETYNDPVLRWEMSKLEVRGETIKLSAHKKRSKEHKIQVLNKKLQDLIATQGEQTLFSMQNMNRQIALVTQELDQLLEERTRGAMMRTQQEWYDGAETMKKFFFALGKYKARKKIISKIRRKDGSTITDQEQIHKHIESFYANLFKEKTRTNQNFLEGLTFPQVKDKDQSILNDPIMLEEIKIAVNQLADDKCSGIDGLSANWYKMFLPDIVHSLHSVYVKNIHNQSMHGSSRECIISLMDKPDKDLMEIEHWRPLCLLNTDYKVYAKILANRLQCVTPYLISSDQFGFLKNRRMTDNLLELNLIINYCQRVNKPAIITAIDFKKAFDMVNWDSMKEILYKFGFKNTFVQMLMVCFSGFRTCILNNGHMTNYVSMTHGNKQGCPISSIIFDLVVEAIAIRLKNDQNIKGIKIGDSYKALGQFADDLWMVMWYDKHSFDTQFKILKLF